MSNERTTIDQALCRKVQILLNGGATGQEVAKMENISEGTVSRIRKAGFSAEQYRENTRKRVLKEKQKEQEPAEELPGQIEMELPQEPKEMSDQTKLMRFQAAQVEKLMLRMDRIDDTLHMILRCIRRE